MRFENLNVTGVNKCTAPQIDDFNRPGNTVGDGWGTATPSGFVWATTGQAYLDGTAGNLFPDNLGVTPVHSVATISDPGPWDGEMTLLMKFGFPEIGPASSPESGYLAEIADSAGLYSAVVAFSPSVTDGEVTLYSGSGSVVVGTTAVQFARSWTAGIAYMMRWEHGRPTTGIDRVRIWEDGSDEPSTWDLELGSTGTPAFAGSLTGPFLTFDDFTLAPNRPQAWFIESIDADYANRPCYIARCVNADVSDDFSAATTVTFDCTTQTTDWTSVTSGTEIDASVSQGAQIGASGGLQIEFRANSSDGDYPAWSYTHNYSDDSRCALTTAAAVGGSLTDFPAFPAIPVRHVVGGTSVTTSGVQITTPVATPVSCEGWSVSAKVSFSSLMTSYSALLPEPGHLDGAYGISGNTTSTFFPRAFIEFMGLFGISLRSNGSGEVAYIGSTAASFPITPGTTYDIVFEAANGSGSLWVWVDGDPQPTDPTVSATFDISGPMFGIFAQQQQFSDDGFAILVSDLLVSGTSESVPQSPTSGGAPAGPIGYGCERATRLSSFTYQTGSFYQSMGTMVWANGLLQRREIDYHENDDHRTLTFSSSVPTDAVVIVCYYSEVLPT